MHRAQLICGATLLLLGLTGMPARAQIQPAPAASPSSAPMPTDQIDGVAARIEDDIITESEVRELGAFQQLVDGKPETRDEILRELADQWLIRAEASAAQYAQPSAADVDRGYAEFVKQYPSAEAFQQKCAAAGLSEAAVRRLIQQQLYLSRFIDYRFRPAAQVTDQQVADYYQNTFVPQLQARHAEIPPLDDVDDTIREVLIQRAISDRETKWLDETRGRLKIDVMSKEGGS
ncbi:MAG TPA: hypothetical protein VGD60_17580 [Candidatus Acidoferrales bacterium]